MNKKILVLETSATMQKLFATTLDGNDFSVQFVKDGKEAVRALFDVVPDLFLLNAELTDPRSFEVVRLVRSIPCFKNLAIGMYATSPLPFDEEFAKMSGADSFVRIDQKTVALSVDELAQIPAQKIDRLAVQQAKKNMDESYLFTNALCVLKDDSVQNAALSELISMTNHIESLENLAQSFLSLVSEFCEVPACALYLLENDGVHGYYMSASTMGEKETADFLGVCGADFERVQPDFNIAKLVPKKLESKIDLSRFYSKDVQLSSYENAGLSSADGTQFGTVHIVSEGNVTAEKTAFFNYCAKNAGVLFEKAVIVKRKMFFEKNIRRAFSRFVPEQIIDDLVTQADTSGDKAAVGEKRAIAAAYEIRELLPTVPLGDSVNLASRLEGLTKTYGSQVLVSESVRLDVLESGAKKKGSDEKSEFYFRHLDDVRVKGKAEAVPIYAVDRSESEFPPEYKDAYTKGMDLYKQGIWNLAKDYFEKALAAVEGDKAAKLMQGRCIEFIENPPEHWDGAIAFTTK